MKIFAIADTHLSFSPKVDKPMSIFGDGWENYESRLEEAWRARIGQNDVVIIPGDISWGLKFDEAVPDLEWIHQLPGRKVLLKGNHDLWWSKIGMLNTLYDDMFFLQNHCYPVEGTDIAICGTRGWKLPWNEDFGEHDEKIFRRELIRLEASLKDGSQQAGQLIAAMHYPPAEENNRHSQFTELLEKYGVKTCVYGHLHGAAAFGKGIKGRENGITYNLISLDYLGGIPKLIMEVDEQ